MAYKYFIITFMCPTIQLQEIWKCDNYRWKGGFIVMSNAILCALGIEPYKGKYVSGNALHEVAMNGDRWPRIVVESYL